MKPEELEIGAKWLAILNAYSYEFSTKSLFNQTAAYLKATHAGGKKVSKFKREVKTDNILTKEVKAPEQRVSLLDAARIREQKEIEDSHLASNLLAISETDEFQNTKSRKKPK